MIRAVFASLVATLVALSAAAQAPTPRPEPTAADMHRLVLDKDLSVMVEWFAGRWDNDLQVFFAKDLKTPEAERHGRIHSIFRPLDLPAFGKSVFYVEQYSDNDPAKIYRQRIYNFVVDPAENAIRLDILIPKDTAKLLGAWRDPAKLAGLTKEQTTTYPGCAVYWRRQGSQFIGAMKPGACRVTSQRDGRTLVITDDLVLSQSALSIHDRAVDAAGVYVYGNKAGIPHQLRKARMFQCWVAVLRGAKHGDSGGGLNDWQFQRELLIHDQGGELAIRTDETPPRDFFLRLRAVEWPMGANRASLTLYVHEKGNDRALSYVWGEIEAQRLGINVRWLQASCTHAPDATFK
jgi:hypothetical protein